MPHPFETSIDLVVRSTEIDVNGHVNNAKYVEYLEWGREDWYERLGMDYATLEKLGAITVAVNLNLNFRKECNQGDRLRVTTRPERLGNTSFAVKQEVVRDPGGEVVADAVFTIVTIDPQTRRPRSVPEPLARAFRKGEAAP